MTTNACEERWLQRPTNTRLRRHDDDDERETSVTPGTSATTAPTKRTNEISRKSLSYLETVFAFRTDTGRLRTDTGRRSAQPNSQRPVIAFLRRTVACSSPSLLTTLSPPITSPTCPHQFQTPKNAYLFRLSFRCHPTWPPFFTGVVPWFYVGLIVLDSHRQHYNNKTKSKRPLHFFFPYKNEPVFPCLLMALAPPLRLVRNWEGPA